MKRQRMSSNFRGEAQVAPGAVRRRRPRRGCNTGRDFAVFKLFVTLELGRPSAHPVPRRNHMTRTLVALLLLCPPPGSRAGLRPPRPRPRAVPEERLRRVHDPSSRPHQDDGRRHAVQDAPEDLSRQLRGSPRPGRGERLRLLLANPARHYGRAERADHGVFLAPFATQESRESVRQNANFHALYFAICHGQEAGKAAVHDLAG